MQIIIRMKTCSTVGEARRLKEKVVVLMVAVGAGRVMLRTCSGCLAMKREIFHQTDCLLMAEVTRLSLLG
jgi:hypothetical protein